MTQYEKAVETIKRMDKHDIHKMTKENYGECKVCGSLLYKVWNICNRTTRIVCKNRTCSNYEVELI